MKNILDILFLNHSTWIDYVKSFGCKEEIAEDFVQEMYIKIYKYNERKDSKLIMFNDNEINHYFIYTCLKNMYFDSLRRNKKMIFEDLKDYEYDNDYCETNFNLKLEAVENWQKFILTEIENIEGNTRRKTNLTYMHFVFQKVFIDQMSVRQFSKEVGITYWSLRNTVLLIKEMIKNDNKFI